MECKKCGNKDKFQALVTDYHPAEVWEFSVGDMTRYNQPDSGDLEIKVTCLKCDSKQVDLQGFKLEDYAGKKLETLSDEQWDAKISA